MMLNINMVDDNNNTKKFPFYFQPSSLFSNVEWMNKRTGQKSNNLITEKTAVCIIYKMNCLIDGNNIYKLVQIASERKNSTEYISGAVHAKRRSLAQHYYVRN